MSKKEFNCFKLDVKNHVGNLVLSRPDELNTMSRDFWVELGEVLEVSLEIPPLEFPPPNIVKEEL